MCKTKRSESGVVEGIEGRERKCLFTNYKSVAYAIERVLEIGCTIMSMYLPVMGGTQRIQDTKLYNMKFCHSFFRLLY